MKYCRKDIIELRIQGMTIRQIMKRLGISSPSVVQHHLTQAQLKQSRLENLFVFPERFPEAGDKQSELMCSGFNEYRRLVKEVILELASPHPKKEEVG